eukprot:3244591-Alexandrium_andersonii.AAC.1
MARSRLQGRGLGSFGDMLACPCAGACNLSVGSKSSLLLCVHLVLPYISTAPCSLVSGVRSLNGCGRLGRRRFCASTREILRSRRAQPSWSVCAGGA